MSEPQDNGGDGNDGIDGLRRRPYTRLWFRAQAPLEAAAPLFDDRLVSSDLSSVSGTGRPIFASVPAIRPEQFFLDYED